MDGDGKGDSSESKGVVRKGREEGIREIERERRKRGEQGRQDIE